MPYEAADKLADEYTPMAAYLGKKIGREGGKFFPVCDVMCALIDVPEEARHSE